MKLEDVKWHAQFVKESEFLPDEKDVDALVEAVIALVEVAEAAQAYVNVGYSDTYNRLVDALAKFDLPQIL